MQATVRLIFTETAPDRPTWPYMNYDARARGARIQAMLETAVPGVRFIPAYCTTRADAEAALAAGPAAVDGALVVMLAIAPDVVRYVIDRVRPAIVADEPYCGTGGFLNIVSQIEAEHLPVATVASTEPADLVAAAKILETLARVRRAKVLCVTNSPDHWGPAGGKPIAELFGTQMVTLNADALNGRYETIPDAAAADIRDRWIRQAEAVVEPDADELLRSARLYLAMRQLVEAHNADAITVDCLSLYYAGQLKAYPCMGFFQMSNDGQIGVCEGDMASVLSHMIFRYLADRPGYVSDPVLDTASNQIIYAHCVAPGRPLGAAGPPCPYRIRSHAEDGRGAAVQSLLPLGQTVTSVAISARSRAMAVSTAKTVTNINDDRACRTKLAAEIDAETVMRNWHFEWFGWHQVTCYGDWRAQLKHIARLMGLRIVEQDRR